MFSKIAKENSDDKISAKNGGDMGNVSPQQMSDIVAKSVFNLKLNTISDIVKTSNGYHILLVSERTKTHYEPFEKVKDDIFNLLKKEKQDKILDNYAISLKQHAKIKYVNSEYASKK